MWQYLIVLGLALLFVGCIWAMLVLAEKHTEREMERFNAAWLKERREKAEARHTQQ